MELVAPGHKGSQELTLFWAGDAVGMSPPSESHFDVYILGKWLKCASVYPRVLLSQLLTTKASN